MAGWSGPFLSDDETTTDTSVMFLLGLVCKQCASGVVTCSVNDRLS